jgi:hypothetical protein
MGNHPHDGSGGRRSRRCCSRPMWLEAAGGQREMSRLAMGRMATGSTGAGRRSRHLPRSGLVQWHLADVLTRYCRSTAGHPPCTGTTPAIGSTRISSLVPAPTWAKAWTTIEPTARGAMPRSTLPPVDVLLTAHGLRVRRAAELSAQSARFWRGTTTVLRRTCTIHVPRRPQTGSTPERRFAMSIRLQTGTTHPLCTRPVLGPHYSVHN